MVERRYIPPTREFQQGLGKDERSVLGSTTIAAALEGEYYPDIPDVEKLPNHSLTLQPASDDPVQVANKAVSDLCELPTPETDEQ